MFNPSSAPHFTLKPALAVAAALLPLQIVLTGHKFVYELQWQALFLESDLSCRFSQLLFSPWVIRERTQTRAHVSAVPLP